MAADNNYAVSKTYVDNQLSVYERATYADLETAKSNAITATNNANAAVTNLTTSVNDALDKIDTSLADALQKIDDKLNTLGNMAYVNYTVSKTI